VEKKGSNKKKREGKRKMSWWIMSLLIIIAVLGVGGAIGWPFFSKEHKEARNIPIKNVDFSRLNDGTYIGEYEGGMYKWRYNKVQVIVSSGNVTNIKLLKPESQLKDKIHTKLYDRVIENQSLQVDTISGATLTSKGYLKGLENALEQAQIN
jgi:uncharacterized protein with FMN-binding domain